MKMYLPAIVCVLLNQYAFCQAQAAPVAADFAKLSWLQGEWNRVNIKPGRTGHERWIKIADNQLMGWGISMKGRDTAFVEKLQVIVKDNRIFYVADVTGNKQPVYFTMTRLTDSSFACENPANDFPKKIAYQLEGNTIRAVISGDGKSVDYIFEKKQRASPQAF